MKMPTIHGIIDRRILINFTADPDITQRIIPAPFKPKIYKNKAIVGICLIRLKKIRPKGLPSFIGISSENAAHRIAVEWERDGITKEGVYIPRRDSSSYFNHLVGGRFFPGKHFHAKFDVREDSNNYQVGFKSEDGTAISINATRTNNFNPKSIFESLSNASDFFEGGSTGYSPKGNSHEGLTLKTFKWQVEPLHVNSVYSSFFEDRTIFPPDSISFDNALLMTQINHEWHSLAKLGSDT